MTIHCETDKGERIIIEMQNREQPHFKDRALYYLSHSVVEQGIKGTWDYELAAVYGVFFLNFTLDEENGSDKNGRREIPKGHHIGGPGDRTGIQPQVPPNLY